MINFGPACAIITLHVYHCSHDRYQIYHMIGTKTTPRTDRYLSGISFQRTEPIPDINIGNRSVLGVLEDRPNGSTESIGNSTIVEPNRPKPANLPVRSGSGIGSGPTECQLWVEFWIPAENTHKTLSSAFVDGSH